MKRKFTAVEKEFVFDSWKNGIGFWTDPTSVDKFCPHDEACSKASGLSTKEILRCLKRYIVRELYPLIVGDVFFKIATCTKRHGAHLGQGPAPAA